MGFQNGVQILLPFAQAVVLLVNCTGIVQPGNGRLIISCLARIHNLFGFELAFLYAPIGILRSGGFNYLT